MRVGFETATSVQVVLLWSFFSIKVTAAAKVARGNPLGIDFDPAPSPENGPPLSAHASRNKALLPAQISGIVGAYLLCLCVILLALAILNKHRRRRILQNAGKCGDIELRVPNQNIAYQYETAPATATQRNFSWPSPEKNDPNPYVFPPSAHSPRSPVESQKSIFDTRVVEADRELLQRDLEDIYAHVMEQDAAKAAGVNVKELPPPSVHSAMSAGWQPQELEKRPEKLEKRPEKLEKRLEKSKALKLNISATEGSPSKHSSRASSIISSLKSPNRKGIRGMRISSPIPTPSSGKFPSSIASDEEPLSPRFYAPPPPPPIPKDQVPFGHTRSTSSVNSVSPTRSVQFCPKPPSGRLHRSSPSETSMRSSSDPSHSATSATSQTPLYPAIRQANNSTPKSAHSNNSSSRALPLRQFDTALVSPTLTQSTKTTVLERITSPHGGVNTAGLRTPWSAGAVPYSPYQPFTPMMPITPRLVTKEDRKAQRKMMPKTPVLEMIRSDDEIWDSGY